MRHRARWNNAFLSRSNCHRFKSTNHDGQYAIAFLLTQQHNRLSGWKFDSNTYDFNVAHVSTLPLTAPNGSVARLVLGAPNSVFEQRGVKCQTRARDLFGSCLFASLAGSSFRTAQRRNKLIDKSRFAIGSSTKCAQMPRIDPETKKMSYRANDR